ncbi:hypothetical protein K469DRAFT_689203 [Zopfia rhizophila CBS 207.26]|uniref:Uncharacterized protein n=1 Tax=Zopfia rhizophila CBS 207.26 TaxID=1314779 RepID=A0A6A6ES84_9PEZI|nr:hypothetical protein K469DRAFT_689203 [Zopfia rhizophila CBS 207.26]
MAFPSSFAMLFNYLTDFLQSPTVLPHPILRYPTISSSTVETPNTSPIAPQNRIRHGAMETNARNPGYGFSYALNTPAQITSGRFEDVQELLVGRQGWLTIMELIRYTFRFRRRRLYWTREETKRMRWVPDGDEQQGSFQEVTAGEGQESMNRDQRHDERREGVMETPLDHNTELGPSSYEHNRIKHCRTSKDSDSVQPEETLRRIYETLINLPVPQSQTQKPANEDQRRLLRYLTQTRRSMSATRNCPYRNRKLEAKKESGIEREEDGDV